MNETTQTKMSNDQLQIRGMISVLPQSYQDEIHAKAEEIRKVIRSSKHGLMACALVGIEIQDDEELAGTMLGKDGENAPPNAGDESELLSAAIGLVDFIRTKWPTIHADGDYLHGGALIKIEAAIENLRKGKAV